MMDDNKNSMDYSQFTKKGVSMNYSDLVKDENNADNKMVDSIHYVNSSENQYAPPILIADNRNGNLSQLNDQNVNKSYVDLAKDFFDSLQNKNQIPMQNSSLNNEIVKDTGGPENSQTDNPNFSLGAFQDSGNIQLNQEEARIYAQYSQYIKDLYINDFIIANIVFDLYQNSIRYNPETDEWLIVQGAYWSSDQKLLTVCIYYAIEAYRRCLTYNINTNSASSAKKSDIRFLVANINRFASANKIDSIVRLLKAFPFLGISNAEINQQKDIIIYNNALIHLRTGNIIGVNQLTSYHINHIDIPSLRNELGFVHAGSDEFLKFVDRLFDGNAELIDFVQKAIGYCLTGETDAGYFFIAYGDGNNGKTTFIDCIRNAVGDYAAEIPFRYLTASQVNISTLPELENARTKRLLIFKSSNHYQELNKDILKALTNGGPINIKHSKSRQYSYIPDFKIWINLDALPQIENIDDVFWKRLCIIPFKNKFEFQELKGLYSRIMQDKEQVLRWIIEGAKKYYVDRELQFPEIIKEDVKIYYYSQDTVGAFLKESTMEEKGKTIMAKLLYDCYLDFCFVNGFDPLSMTRFGKAVKNRGIKYARIGDGMKYYDIKIAK